MAPATHYRRSSFFSLFTPALTLALLAPRHFQGNLFALFAFRHSHMPIAQMPAPSVSPASNRRPHPRKRERPGTESSNQNKKARQEGSYQHRESSPAIPPPSSQSQGHPSSDGSRPRPQNHATNQHTISSDEHQSNEEMDEPQEDDDHPLLQTPDAWITVLGSLDARARYAFPTICLL